MRLYICTSCVCVCYLLARQEILQKRGLMPPQDYKELFYQDDNPTLVMRLAAGVQL